MIGLSDEVEQIWYWEYKNDDGEITKFFMDGGKRVRYVWHGDAR